MWLNVIKLHSIKKANRVNINKKIIYFTAKQFVYYIFNKFRMTD